MSTACAMIDAIARLFERFSDLETDPRAIYRSPRRLSQQLADEFVDLLYEHASAFDFPAAIERMKTGRFVCDDKVCTIHLLQRIGRLIYDWNYSRLSDEGALSCFASLLRTHAHELPSVIEQLSDYGSYLAHAA